MSKRERKKETKNENMKGTEKNMTGSYIGLQKERRKISLSYDFRKITHMSLHSVSTESLARLKVVNSTWQTKCLV